MREIRFTDKSSTIDVLYPVTQWLARIQTPLEIHVMHLVGGNKWVIFLPEDGEIHLLPAFSSYEQSTFLQSNVHTVQAG